LLKLERQYQKPKGNNMESKRYQAAVWYLSGKGTQVEAAKLFGIKQATVSQAVKFWKERIQKEAPKE